MNMIIRPALTAILAAATISLAEGAEDKAPAPEAKKSLRVIAGPERPRPMDRREPVEKETVAFLGVETAPVSATLAAQLGLPRGTGLVVNHIVPNSPAAGALQTHDILLQLDDQILIETRQLSVLIRTHKEGDEVTVAYVRGGQKGSAKVKLGKTEVPKTMSMLAPGGVPFRTAPLREQFDFLMPRGDSDEERADVDRVLSMIQRHPSGDPVRIQVDRKGGPGFRALAIHTGNSNMVFSDDEGSLELTSKEGAKSLVAKSPQGEVIFQGPVNTPEERQAMPAPVRDRLERLEGMRDISFHTDGEFKGAEVRVITPRGIAYPTTPRPATAPLPPRFY
jgi:serine protease Do